MLNTRRAFNYDQKTNKEAEAFYLNLGWVKVGEWLIKRNNVFEDPYDDGKVTNFLHACKEINHWSGANLQCRGCLKYVPKEIKTIQKMLILSSKT